MKFLFGVGRSYLTEVSQSYLQDIRVSDPRVEEVRCAVSGGRIHSIKIFYRERIENGGRVDHPLYLSPAPFHLGRTEPSLSRFIKGTDPESKLELIRL